MSERRPPEDLFEALLDYEHDDPDAKPIAEMTAAECDAELRSRGVDPAAVAARGAAHARKLLDQLGAPPPAAPHVAHAQPAPVPVAAAGRTVWLWVAAAVVVAVVALRLLFGGNGDIAPKAPDPTPSPVLGDANAPPEPKGDLLVAARAACSRDAWAECLRAVEGAEAADPTGVQGDEERALRDVAMRGLANATKDAGPDKRPPGPDPKGPH